MQQTNAQLALSLADSHGLPSTTETLDLAHAYHEWLEERDPLTDFRPGIGGPKNPPPVTPPVGT